MKKFALLTLALLFAVLSTIGAVNYSIDSSFVWHRNYSELAELALSDNMVAVPTNYNERQYQVAIVDKMEHYPDTIVIGSSRGFYLGADITGIDSIYNNCVSGACMADYYALIGLYYKKGVIPSTVIVEVSPWCFYDGNGESRWREVKQYKESYFDFYRIVNGTEISDYNYFESSLSLFSLPYFQYNLLVLRDIGIKAFDGLPVKISDDPDEAADYPDGSFRYPSNLENESTTRTETVINTSSGPVTYHGSNNMTEISVSLSDDFENLISYLVENNVDVVLFMSPFSKTQSEYIFDNNTNLTFSLVEDYVLALADKYGCTVIGGFDSREYGLEDDQFIDNMHMDKEAIRLIWTADYLRRDI